MVLYCIENNISGLYNFSSSVPITKYELLLIIKDVFNKDNFVKDYWG